VNGCVPSTLHQCLIQWVGEEVEVIPAEGAVCIAVLPLRYLALSHGHERNN
jgi:hypothetical protein